jgi:ADP-ribose pyrophosphatase YjhB (NUDIX family)
MREHSNNNIFSALFEEDNMEERIIQTIGIFCRGPLVLLGMKLRGFGVGFWNGPGGKFEPAKDRNVEESFDREALEEAVLTVKRKEKVGYIEFEFVNKPGKVLETHIFRVLEYEGEPQDGEEMRWQWFGEAEKEIPYQQLWPADEYWLPPVLAGKKIRGKVRYDSKEAKNILFKDLREVEEI